jgi:hypothetical protein
VNRREQRWPVTLAKVSLALVGCLFLGLADECDRSDPHGMHARHENERPIRRRTNELLEMSRASMDPVVRNFTFSLADGLFTSVCHGRRFSFWSLREIEPRCFESASAVYCAGTRCAHEVEPLFGIERGARNRECPTDCSFDQGKLALRIWAIRGGRKLHEQTYRGSEAYWLRSFLATLNAGGRSDSRGYLSQLVLNAVWQETCDRLGVTLPARFANSPEAILDGLADLPIINIGCDFAILTNGSFVRYRNGAWVAVPQ